MSVTLEAAGPGAWGSLPYRNFTCPQREDAQGTRPLQSITESARSRSADRRSTSLAGTTPAQAGEPVWAVCPAPGHALRGLQQPGAGQGTATAPTPSLLVPPRSSPFWESLGYCRRLPSLLLAGWEVGPPPPGAATLWPCTRGPSLFPKASSQQVFALMVGNGGNFHQFVLGGVEF